LRETLRLIAQLDEAIGGVLKTLSDSGQAERTLVFFFSDNGGSAKQPAINLPLRGSKGNEYEGGIRVPFLVRFPGKIPAGTTYEQPVSSVDVFGTSLALAGVSIPTDKKYDGVNLIPYLNGEKKDSPHEKLFWRQGKNYVVREGNWKLIQNGEEPIELYDISNDIGESTNLATEQQEIAERLTQSLNVWKSEIIAALPPGEGTKQKIREEAARKAALQQSRKAATTQKTE
jgi:arylsulfatase A-like enzyme